MPSRFTHSIYVWSDERHRFVLYGRSLSSEQAIIYARRASTLTPNGLAYTRAIGGDIEHRFQGGELVEQFPDTQGVTP